MAEIRKLSSHLSDLIAAGEVVERPQSVVKELLENAIDAKAKNIVIEIENGGISYIRVTDDGKGMTEDDAKICFLRHATSKIYNEDDLFSIKTLGFRGEALAAISAVSKIDLFTKRKDESEGTFISCIAGQVEKIYKTGAKDGTTIIVRDLFYNTPARMKFLKKDFTESSYIASIVENIALSHPEISFKFIKDSKLMFKTSGNSDLKAVVYNVLGKEISNEILEVEPFTMDKITVSGFISKPHFAKANRNTQYIFINGRFIKSRTISSSLEDSYKNYVMTGKFPVCVLNLTVDERTVDVNVHPTKLEVKFENEKKIYDIVNIVCKNTLEKTSIIVSSKNIKIKEQNFSSEEIIAEPISIESIDNFELKSTSKLFDKPENSKSNYYEINAKKEQEEIKIEKNDSMLGLESPRVEYKPSKFVSVKDINIVCDDFDDESDEILQKSEKISTNLSDKKVYPQEVPQEFPQLVEKCASTFEKPIKFIGECFNTYILCEYDGDFIMIDKHAADERIKFNKLLKSKENLQRQLLLVPKILKLPKEEYGNFVENIEEINALGFLIEDFADNSIIVREVPQVVENECLEQVILEISDKLMHRGKAEISKIDDMLHTIACKGAIKGNRFTSEYELKKLCEMVLTNENINYCPHGRPIKVSITKYQIERMFKRS